MRRTCRRCLSWSAVGGRTRDHLQEVASAGQVDLPKVDRDFFEARRNG